MAADEDAPALLDRVEEWRYKVLLEVGYDVDDAFRLACARYVDLHDAVALAKRCPPALAAEILI